MRSIENGIINTLSPSMMDLFDNDSAFGCETRAALKYVFGYKEPSTEAMDDGTVLHDMNKVYLKEDKLLISDQKHQDRFKSGLWFLDKMKPLIIAVEEPVKMLVDGIPIHDRSACDVVTREPGIIDWKTTSDIEKWGKTPGQLARNNQLIIYARAFHPNAASVKLTHGYYQTKARTIFKPVSVEVGRSELDDHYGTVILPLVARMKAVAKVKDEHDLKQLRHNPNTCRLNTKYACPHASICPAIKKENPLMGMFDKYKAATQSTASSPAPSGVLPPDAPKSDPSQAAKPVEGFQAVPPPKSEAEKAERAKVVEAAKRITDVSTPASAAAEVDDEEAELERKLAAKKAEKARLAAEAAAKAKAEAEEKAKKEAAQRAEQEKAAKEQWDEDPNKNSAAEEKKRGPGRPPGAKNKRTLAMEAAAVEGVVFESVTVTRGFTLNMGDFNSARFDVSMTAKHGPGEADAAYQMVLDAVNEEVEKEFAKIKQATQLKVVK